MIKRKEGELCFLSQAIDTMECGWTANLMERVVWFTPTEMFMKECGLWERGADTEYSQRDVEIISKDIG